MNPQQNDKGYEMNGLFIEFIVGLYVLPIASIAVANLRRPTWMA